MPDTYTFTGKDGVARSFVGDRPPSASEMAALEQAEAPTSAMPRPAGWQPAGTYETSDGPAAPPSRLMEMLGPLAHPQTLDDFGHLLGVPVDHIRSAAIRALAMASARPAAGAALSATGRGLESAGTMITPGASTTIGVADMMTSHQPLRALAVAAAPSVLKATGRGLQRAGTAVTGEIAPAVSEAAPAIAETAPAAAPAVDEFTAARSARSSALPDQKALNEAALAARRAAYQASQSAPAGAAETIVKESGKQHFTAPEWAAFRELRARGLGLEEAASGARAAGELARRFGGATDAEVAAAVKHRGTTGKW